MKIEKLIIYGFGRHENLTIDLKGNLTVFFGENESGKTTIQQFIIQVLFGFPARNQSFQRYEPKMGGKYGGQIHMRDEQNGTVIVERVKGKSAGEVTVFFEDGSRGAEDELRGLLQNYDRQSFEAVFSFSVHELQGLERLSEEELSRTLLASGTIGVDAISQMESTLQKEMGALYKKTGRIPAINKLIEELRDLEEELKEFRSRSEFYQPHLQRIQWIKSKLETLDDEETRSNVELKAADKWLQAAPLIEQKKQLEWELADLAMEDFPMDARRRMERLADRLSEAAAKNEHLTQQMKGLKESDWDVEDPAPIASLLSRESEWHQMRSAYRLKQEETAQFIAEKNRLLNLVGMGEERVLKSDVSLNKEERLIHFIQQVDLEEEEARFEKRKLSETRQKLEDIERELQYMNSHGPSLKERELAEEWPRISEKLAEAKALKTMQGTGNSKLMGFVLLGLGGAGLLFGFLQPNYALAVLSLLIAVSGVWFLRRSVSSAGMPTKYEKLLAEYQGREHELTELSSKVMNSDRSKEEKSKEIASLKQAISRLSPEHGEQPAKRAYEQFLQELGLVTESSRTTVLDLFDKLREIQAIESKLALAFESMGQIESRINKTLQEAEEVCGKLISADELFLILRIEFNSRQKLLAEAEAIEMKRKEYQQEFQQASILFEQLKREQGELLDSARAEDLEQFYRMCDRWQRREEILAELKPVRSQLESMDSPVAPEGFHSDTYIAERQNVLLQHREERNELVKELADKQQEMRFLLTDDSYEEKQQLFEAKKTHFAELALQWSADKAITEAIKQTMEELKEKQLPAVISEARRFFEHLTLGAYTDLSMNPDGFFEAARSDGIHFHISELSQATKEQAYLALRLALAANMKDRHPFPIIMDDPFVHFDTRRLQQMINLLTELQSNHQFIYFTCHKALQKALPEADVIEVANIGRSVHT